MLIWCVAVTVLLLFSEVSDQMSNLTVNCVSILYKPRISYSTYPLHIDAISSCIFGATDCSTSKNLFYTVQTKIVSSTTSTVIKNTDTNLLCLLAAVAVTSGTAARAGMLDLHGAT